MVGKGSIAEYQSDIQGLKECFDSTELLPAMMWTKFIYPTIFIYA